MQINNSTRLSYVFLPVWQNKKLNNVLKLCTVKISKISSNQWGWYKALVSFNDDHFVIWRDFQTFGVYKRIISCQQNKIYLALWVFFVSNIVLLILSEAFFAYVVLVVHSVINYQLSVKFKYFKFLWNFLSSDLDVLKNF